MTSTSTSKSTTSSTPSSIAGSGVEGEDHRNNSSSLPPSETIAITYDPPPASWFFARGSKDYSDNHQSGEQTNSEKKPLRDVVVVNSSFPSIEIKGDHSSDTEIKDHKNSNSATDDHLRSDTDPGMVSDNEEDDDYLEHEHEGFNFVAISNSLLMAGRSFEHVLPESPKEDTETRSGTSKSDKDRGVLIVDGVASDSSEENAHKQDASILTLPGSDSLPSDIGTICHHDEEDDEDEEEEDPSGCLFGQGGHHPSGDESSEQANQEPREAPEDPYSENKTLIHVFLENIQKTRRLRLVSDASDENACVQSSGVSVVRNDDDDLSMAWTVETREDRFSRGLLKFFFGIYGKRRFLPIVLVAVVLATAFVCRSFVVSQRDQREAWEQRLLREGEAMVRIMAEKESLRQEMEVLIEEAAVASVRAESLVLLLQKQEAEKEQIRLHQEEAEKGRIRAEKERILLLKEQEQRTQQERQTQNRRRQQPWRSDSNDESFGWFLDGSKEECNAHKEDGSSSTYTIADNCWFKAKADINLGNCGDETKEYVKGFWNGLWEDWDYYFDEPIRSDALEPFSASSSSSGNQLKELDRSGKQSNDFDNDYYRIGSGNDEKEREGDYDDQGNFYKYQDDTYYPPQDPLQDLFSVVHSASQFFVDTLSNLVSEEVESTQKAAREMEETVWRKYSEASHTIVDAMETAKEDMRELSSEALSALRTAVQKSSSKNSHKTNEREKGTPKNNDQSFHSGPDAKKEAKTPSHQQTPQQVTRKGLYDAATAVNSLSKSWKEYLEPSPSPSP